MFRLFRVVGINLIILFVGQVGIVLGASEDWKLLKQRAEEIYRGIDAKVNVTIIDVTNVTMDEKRLQGNVSIEVPIFSWKEREEKRKAKVLFLKEGANIIREIEEAEEMLKVWQEKERVLRKSLIEGVEDVEEYFNLKIEIVKSKLLLIQKRRELEILCGKK